MSDYTYDLHQDEEGFEHLTDTQRNLGQTINTVARTHGTDRAVLLAEADAPNADKAALAEVWGGPGAGAEFLR